MIYAKDWYIKNLTSNCITTVFGKVFMNLCLKSIKTVTNLTHFSTWESEVYEKKLKPSEFW